MRYGLTPRQYDLFKFIEEYIKKNKYSPSQGEISQVLKTHETAARDVLQALKIRGWIDWVPGHSRSITVLPDTNHYYPGQYQPFMASESNRIGEEF